MFRHRASLWWPLAVIACLPLLSACNVRDVAAVGEEGNPLVVLLSPSHAADQATRDRLADFLAEETGLVVRVEGASSHEAAITKVGAAWADAALLPTMSYLFCVQEYGVQAALQVVRGGDERAYVGEILVRGEADISSVADLEGKRLAFTDAYSTTGFLLPAALLRQEGVTVDYVFAGSHDEALAQLRAGAVDAAATYQGASGDDPALRTVATTESVPNEPFFVRADLDPVVGDKLVAALLALAESAEGRATLSEIADITGFVPVSNDHYTSVDRVLQAAERSVEDLVPRGWLIRNQNQLSPVDYAP